MVKTNFMSLLEDLDKLYEEDLNKDEIEAKIEELGLTDSYHKVMEVLNKDGFSAYVGDIKSNDNNYFDGSDVIELLVSGQAPVEEDDYTELNDSTLIDVSDYDDRHNIDAYRLGDNAAYDIIYRAIEDQLEKTFSDGVVEDYEDYRVVVIPDEDDRDFEIDSSTDAEDHIIEIVNSFDNEVGSTADVLSVDDNDLTFDDFKVYIFKDAK